MIISLTTTFDIDERYTVDPEIARINKAQLVKSITRTELPEVIGSGFLMPQYPKYVRGFWIEFLKPIGWQTGIFFKDEAINLVTYDGNEETIHFYDNQDTSWTMAPVRIAAQTERINENDSRYKK